MSSNSKRTIASVAALAILLYHCWIPVFGYGTVIGSAERFLVAATYFGVDTFFFISAFSLVARPVTNYREFIINRAVKILPLFFIALVFRYFLWFLPSIMFMYIVLPLLYRVCRRRPAISFILLLLGWAGTVYLVLGVIRPEQDFGIFLFRIPSIILGAYAVKFKDMMKTRRALIAGILLLIIGTVLVYRFGYFRRINIPFRGTFYLTGIPVMLGTVLLVNYFDSDRRRRVPELIGRMTLELYFTQMVLGTVLINSAFRLTGSRLFTNVITLVVIFIVSFGIRILNDGIMKCYQTLKAKRSDTI